MKSLQVELKFHNFITWKMFMVCVDCPDLSVKLNFELLRSNEWISMSDKISRGFIQEIIATRTLKR